MRYLKTLGELSLHEGGPDGAVLLDGSKALAVCGVLAARPAHSASRDYLCAVLWPAVEPSRRRRALRQALHYLAKRAGGRLIEADDVTLTLDTDKLSVDLHELERAVRDSDDRRVVELYGGRFLGGLRSAGARELEELADSQDAHVRAGVEVAYCRLVNGSLAAGEVAAAVGYARRYVALNPLDEAAQVALVRALKANGELVGAHQAYRAYHALLGAALEETPCAELERMGAAVHEALTSGPASLPVQPPSGATAGYAWVWALAGGTLGALLALGLSLLVLA